MLNTNLNLSDFLRGTKPDDQVRVHHAALTLGPVQTYAIGSDQSTARRRVRKLLDVHVHALSAIDAKNHKPTTVGIPEHYKLAQL